MVKVGLYEGGSEQTPVSAFVGDLSTIYLELRDHDGAPVDTTTGTLSASYTNATTGAAYTFASGTATLTKVANSVGLISLLNPNVYPSAAKVRVVITLTNGTVIRKFGPMIITVQSV
jgi:hypothetical protein